MDQIILTPVTKAELIKELKTMIDQALEAHREKSIYAKEYLTAKETEELLKISHMTRIAWTKAGIITGAKIGGRTRYRRDQIVKALETIEKKH